HEQDNPLTIIMDAAKSLITNFNNRPHPPLNISPTNNAVDVTLTPTLDSSLFSDPDGSDTHRASQWQIRSESETYDSPIWDSGEDTTNLNNVSVPTGTLDYSTRYFWHVRHQDNHLGWSEYSSETNFTTIVPSQIMVTTPNGSERLIAGWMYTVRWQSQGDIASVIIEYSGDNGSTWIVADPCASNIGSYRWLVPDITSPQCLVRVSDTSDLGVFDTSQDIFTICDNTLQFKVIDLGTLGGGWSVACGINDNGQVVGYAPIPGGYQHAFLYENGEMTDLGTLGGIRSVANAINESGQIVGYATTSSGYNHAFLYEDGIMRDLGTLGGSQSIADSINSAGQVVGKSHNAQGFWRAFLYDDGEMMDISVVNFQRAYDINGKRQIVGWAGSAILSYACLYEDGTLTDLGTLGGPLNIAYGINESSQIVGISSVNRWDEHAFLYENGVMTDLGTLCGINSEARCINESGQIVGSADTAEGHRRAFLCVEGMMADLNTLVGVDSGITLEVARGINNHGWIVGYGKNTNNDNRAFLLIPSALRLLRPDGGEILSAGTEYMVRWESEGNIENVLIEYSIDSGSTWREASPPNTGNSGSYSWSVPYVSSKRCLVRISDINDESISDVSNSEFTITGILYVDDDALHDPEPSNPDISDPNEDGSPEHPFDSIQEAIDFSIYGYIVTVLPGIYEKINFSGKNIILTSIEPNDSNVVVNTIIDGSQSGSVVTFNGGEDANCVLAGFTITNGKANKGGGICIFSSSSPVIKNCIIRDNTVISSGPGSGGGVKCDDGGTFKIINCVIMNNRSEYDGGGIYFSDDIVLHPSFVTERPEIIDCTIVDNVAEGGYGGGICCWEGDVLISNCNISFNTAGLKGGGILCGGDCEPNIVGNNISQCFAPLGGGIYTSGTSPNIVNNEIFDNISTNGGGGIFCDYGTPMISNNWITCNYHSGIYSHESLVTISNNIIAGNKGFLSGGIACDANSTATIKNNTIVDNWGVDSGGIGLNTGALAVVKNNIIWGNLTDTNENQISLFSNEKLTRLDINYTDIKDGPENIYLQDSNCIVTFGMGNINVDPCFIMNGYWDGNSTPSDTNDDFWNKGDYHVQSQAGRWDPNTLTWAYDDVMSPCVDAGDPNSDWTSELWPHGKWINMGAYGGTPEASMSQLKLGNISNLDYDPNEFTNNKDLAVFVEEWCLRDIPLIADLNRDANTNFTDFAIFAGFWGKTTGTGLVGHWKFDEGYGQTAYDSSGYSNDGQLGSTSNADQNDPAWVKDPNHGWCLDFDGGDYVKTEDTTNGLDFAPHSFSVSAWINAIQFPQT
ncbi:MAG: hypothetical protein GWO10_10915, partial [candidate division Zixibacteria bacterium]|nr:hypothetical protein [candidate division Zixibacteria bacterium]